MTSTWRHWDRSRWNFAHWYLDTFRLYQIDDEKEVPVHQKTDKVPHAPEFQFHRWVLLRAFVPMAIHEAYIRYFHHNFPSWAAFLFYHIALQMNAIRMLHIVSQAGHKYGYFDGDKHERDGIPDVAVTKTLASLFSVIFLRPLFMVYLTYDIKQCPSTINWTCLPWEIGIYAIILDFWFYWYHRLMHSTDSLWRFHRTHHLTKHPTALLSSYSDHEQEFCDMVAIPCLAYGTMKLMGFPMGFYEWWVIMEYIVFTELIGHTGLRLEITTLSPLTFLLKMFDVELAVEDHDLHHRKGWKKSYNYGKQTRIWDRIFGTSHPRIEGCADNVDYENPANFVPVF